MRSKVDTSQNGAPMMLAAPSVRHPAPHPSEKPLMPTEPICQEQPSVTAPAGWASRISRRDG